MTTATRVGTGARERLYASTTDTFDGDLDLIAIEHAMNGQPVTLTPAERVEAARRMYERGIELTTIARRVTANPTTIKNWRDGGWQHPETPAEEQPIDLGGASHGRSGYNRGCRCRPCRDGAAESNRLYRARQRTTTAA